MLHSNPQWSGPVSCRLIHSLQLLWSTPTPEADQSHTTLQILELLEHKAIFTAGYKCVLHVHSVVEECECVKLIAAMDPKTKEKKRVRLT